MKQTLNWWAFQVFLSALAYAALGLEIEGALNVLKFLVWFLAVLLPFGMLDESIARSAAKPPVKWAPRGVAWIVDLSILVALVWCDHTFTGIAWAWALIVSFYAHSETAKLRARGAAA